MYENFQSTKLPTSASQITSSGGASWSNPSRITADDGSSASIGYFSGGDSGGQIIGSDFDFQQLPDSAVIDGIQVFIDGTNIGCYGTIALNITGTSTKDIGALSGAYGSNTDLWGSDLIDPSDIANIEVTINTGDVSGGDGIATIDYLSITVFWHLELENTETDVPTRVDYKVFSRDGNFLGYLPDVSSDLVFAEDINSAGSLLTITCAKYVDNEVTVSPLLDESGDIITTEDDEPILATNTQIQVATGSSPDEAIFKNSNRIQAWLTNKYYPNGKCVFSGEVNKLELGDSVVKLYVYSDGLDLNNYVVRGYPFSYTTDVTQNSQNGYVTVSQGEAEHNRYGQTWRTGGSVTNVGAIVLKLEGTATVTLSICDGPNGTLLGRTSQNVSLGTPTDVQFEVAQLIEVNSNDDYFFYISVAKNQSIKVYKHGTSSTYANGALYESIYAGGGGGSYGEISGDLYFITKSGTPTTTATYTSDDPVSDMAHGILLDYNARGGRIRERDFEATGLSLTYTFVVAFIYDAMKKIIELSQTGYYFYVDVGSAEIDIKQISNTADFTVVRGRHINKLNLVLSIEQVKNNLLLSGGEVSPSVNLFKNYSDTQSIANYGIRTATKSDNRIELTDTANAVGETFIEENSDETQETSVKVLNEYIDISKLNPGKTIGFRNYGDFRDNMILQVVRRESNYSKGIATLTLGRLPISTNQEIQRINREVFNEQTINNPTAPS